MADVVSYEVVDGVARVTIERPEVRNAMSVEVFDALAERAAQAGADDEVGAVLVAGRDRTFSSGIDVSVLGGQAEARSRAAASTHASPPPDGGDGSDEASDGISPAFVARLQSAFTAYEELDKPTIAAIEGPCFGAGIQLAAACHLRAVAPDAQLSVMEARWGLVPDLGGTYRLPRLVGLGRATELVMSARRFDAAEALGGGFAQIALDGDDPQADALAHARRLAAGPGSLRRVARLLRENLARDREAALAAEANAQVACIDGPDFAEAVAARGEDRQPRFVGR